MQLQSILFCVQFKFLINNLEKQNFADVSPQGPVVQSTISAIRPGLNFNLLF
jgi:hypothetical protein